MNKSTISKPTGGPQQPLVSAFKMKFCLFEHELVIARACSNVQNVNSTLSDALQNHSTIPVPAQRTQFSQPSPGIQSAVFQQSRVNASDLLQGDHFFSSK